MQEKKKNSKGVRKCDWRLHTSLKKNDENKLFEKGDLQRISFGCAKFQKHTLCIGSSEISTAHDINIFMHVIITYAVNIFIFYSYSDKLIPNLMLRD